MKARSRRGFTLLELVVAAGLLVFVTLAVFQFLGGFMSLWRKSEVRRELVEEGSGITELLAEDLASLANGPRGDLVAEWLFYDTDADGLVETIWPRVRLLREASPADLALLQPGAKQGLDLERRALLEICWSVMPAYSGKSEPDQRAEGILWRGERVQASDGLSFFDPAFFSQGNKPRVAFNEVSGGILWLGLEFATQASVLSQGWSVGAGIEDAATSWDAWNKGRPDAVRHFYNEPGKGMPRVRERAALPRRVRIELELERSVDLKRRTRLARSVAGNDAYLAVEDGERLPAERGAFVKVDAEWMQILSLDGDTASVKRGARGTQALGHERGALVHFGQVVVREIPVRTYQEDWSL